MIITINQYVEVRLNDCGRKRLKENWQWYHDREPAVFKEYTPPAEDAEGWSTWQLWVLMKELGPHISMTADVMFDGFRIASHGQNGGGTGA